MCFIRRFWKTVKSLASATCSSSVSPARRNDDDVEQKVNKVSPNSTPLVFQTDLIQVAQEHVHPNTAQMFPSKWLFCRPSFFSLWLRVVKSRQLPFYLLTGRYFCNSVLDRSRSIHVKETDFEFLEFQRSLHSYRFTLRRSKSSVTISYNPIYN